MIKNHTKGYCVWYGQCTHDQVPAKNCLYNGPAKYLNDARGQQILSDRCPEFRGHPTCCTTSQLEALTSNLQIMEQLTSRCPACWNNIRRLYCQLTCSQDQSLFMDVTSEEYESETNAITAVDYYVSPEFKEGLFNSCKDVTFPGNNEKILSLLCGTSAAKCTPQKLLTFMGSTANGYAPFTINYKTKLAANLTWMNETIFKCNQKFIDPRNNNSKSEA